MCAGAGSRREASSRRWASSLLSMLFSWYAANFGKFNETYGSLGAVIGFMTWMWLSATIVLVGAELNAEIESRRSRRHQPAVSRSKR